MKPRVADIALAVLLTLVAVAGVFVTDGLTPQDRPVDAFAVVLAAAAALPLTFRRVQPLTVLLVVAVAVGLFLWMGYPYGPVWFPFVVASYSAARYRPLRVAAPTALATLPIVVAHIFTHPGSIPGLWGVLPASVWLAVPFLVGLVARQYAEAAERARAELLRRQLDGERLRVVQEVHDVVGHGLAAINMQANIALHVLPDQPDQAERSLEAISRTSEESLTELRNTLRVVQRPGEAAEREPNQGLARIGDLVRRVEDAGVAVEIDAQPCESLPAAVDFAAFRVLQEAMTNVLKHGGAGGVTVGVRCSDGTLVLTVSNSATPTSWSEGMGVSGMRGRVTAVGGRFRAGFTDDRRFEVHAEIPVKGDEQ